jgi:hypothetical protein
VSIFKVLRKVCSEPTMYEYETFCPDCKVKVLYVYAEPIEACYCADCDPQLPSEESCL